jgi:hypothetical protein
MHVAAKIALGIGTALLLIGGLMTVLGGATVDIDEDSFSVEKASIWNGDLSDGGSVTLDLNYTRMYSVYLENGSGDVDELSISIVNDTEGEEYFECEWDEWGESEICWHVEGWTAVGWMLNPECPCELTIQGSGQVMIVDDKLYGEQVEEEAFGFLGSLAAIGTGCCVGCFGIIALIIGIIMAVSMKDVPATGIVVMQSGQTVGGQVNPAYTQQQAVQQPVVVEQTSGTILPPIGGQQPPNQGF